jgi:hypothetical protein
MLTRWIDTAILIIFTPPVLVISRLLIWREALKAARDRHSIDPLIFARTRGFARSARSR